MHLIRPSPFPWMSQIMYHIPQTPCNIPWFLKCSFRCFWTEALQILSTSDVCIHVIRLQCPKGSCQNVREVSWQLTRSITGYAENWKFDGNTAAIDSETIASLSEIRDPQSSQSNWDCLWIVVVDSEWTCWEQLGKLRNYLICLQVGAISIFESLNRAVRKSSNIGRYGTICVAWTCLTPSILITLTVS